MFEFKFPAVCYESCVYMCGKGKLRGRVGGLVGGARRKREGTFSLDDITPQSV